MVRRALSLALAALALTAVTACSSQEPTKIPAAAPAPPAPYAQELQKLGELQTKAGQTQAEAQANMDKVQEGIDAYIAETMSRDAYMKQGLPYLRKNCELFKTYLPATRKELESTTWPQPIAAQVKERVKTYKAIEWSVSSCDKGNFDSTLASVGALPLNSPLWSFSDLMEPLQQ